MGFSVVFCFAVTTAPTDGETGRTHEDTFGVSIAVGLAGFACILLLVLFVLINKYGRRSKFGMKGKSLLIAIQAEHHRHI
ncbi:NT-3 growth factor receptor [Takifugu flavidus]|uniref:NT-3 growth factor receptor n=1 Tax=Takifugu flavidus TaxID=433684 RepID=A0A5C6NI43_9TELE|nr:NT-3 growth factor receptor [Takifugu flavidus]